MKECLRYGLIPFIIEDRKKAFYYRELANRETERGWLRETCADGQDAFRALLQAFGISATE